MNTSLQTDLASKGFSRGEMGRHVSIVIQLLLLAFIADKYELEPTLFLSELFILVSLLYAIYPIIPIKFTVKFFLLSGAGALFYFLGLGNGLIVLGYSLMVIITARYIRPNTFKYLLIGALGALPILLLYLENEWILDHKMALATFGSIFMFRLLIFLYDKQHQKISPSLEMDLAYFFMLPNMAITLFPAVDYTTFINKKSKSHDFSVYRKGVHWITLGVFHLVVYRLIYYYLFIPAPEVSDAITYSWHSLTSYLLIVRLSGIFHISVGILCLFGFDLPPVFNNYFLASGFSDLWRRINIYFREFLIKVFYYPIFFKFRKIGNGPAVIITILLLFTITWLLHSFQWLWLKGKFPIRWIDILFWGAFGLLVAGNAFMDLNRSRGKLEPVSAWTVAGRTTAQIIGMLASMSFLWTLWSANSIGEWLTPMKAAIHSSPKQFVAIIFALIMTWVLGSVTYWFVTKHKLDNRINPLPTSAGAARIGALMISGLLLIQLPYLESIVKTHTPFSLDGIKKAKLNDVDANLMIDGYYTEILVGNELTNPLGQMERPLRERFSESDVAQTVDDFREVIQRPNATTLFKGKPYTTNEWGIRDQSYPLTKPANSIRTVFMGGSFVVGSGVSDDEVFDQVLEEKLNNAQSGIHYEIMNYGSSGYDLIDCLVRFDKDSVPKFKPDYLFIFSHGVDEQKNMKDVGTALKKGKALPYPFLDSIIVESGLTSEMTDIEMIKALRPFGSVIVEKAYQLLYKRCIDNGIKPVWVFWPTVELRPTMYLESETIKPMVEQIGFTVIDLSDVYSGYEPKTLYLSRNDRHPNPKGHALIAERLYLYFETLKPAAMTDEL